ncbi:flavin reductase family protein [Helicobacter mustelae]|uniref:Flavin reductase like domain-containing protein n=1 Tax=Helicobacter mustelae (strain ATCC 43772 / CCUG 25715 / CIP 103759 / LMG 18044 / NCTC 12198 / R85-136P) TaxID=679897 RepID=D3UIA2_HELM1|nr:flavin reductase [Helicobacter mustelae]CBG40225.1 conserved hypothetical protein [Helicobacter mustelae 12198]SQH71724.1 flavin reductase domain protein FMN-binding protein [Helicobacter mustelae]STP12851.1 flavin reductase domain protein FMN-binding protein [Helicobacter mustelae]
MQIKLEQISSLAKLRILDNAITPRPIAWIVSVSEEGVVNLAPFSFFAPVSSEPIVFSICFYSKSNGDPKDSLRNILQSKRATICICEGIHLGAMHKSARELDANISEAALLGIPMQAVIEGYPPIVQGVRLAFMCDFYDLLEIGKFSKTLLLEAKELFCAEELQRENFEFGLENIGQVGREYALSYQLIPARNVK